LFSVSQNLFPVDSTQLNGFTLLGLLHRKNGSSKILRNVGKYSGPPFDTANDMGDLYRLERYPEIRLFSTVSGIALGRCWLLTRRGGNNPFPCDADSKNAKKRKCTLLNYTLEKLYSTKFQQATCYLIYLFHAP
jgi:hypothetical protein